MKCPNCSTQMPDDTTSCPACGAAAGEQATPAQRPGIAVGQRVQAAPDSEPAGTRLTIDQRVAAAAAGSAITGASIGQATAQRDLIIQTFQTLHERTLTAEEAATRAADLELELLARGVRGLAERLAVQATAAPTGGSPYKGLLAYGLGDADRFYGRAAATRSLLALLDRGRLAVLHAESGAGKSSLLQAGIAARLIAAGHLAVYLRPYRSQPVAAIKEAFLDLSRAPRLAGLPLHEFLRYVTAMLPPGETLYLLLDQFEEFFAYLASAGRATFAAELGACLRDESLNVRWLIALRGETLSRLAEMETSGVDPFENQFRLARLTRDEAREAITGPGLAFEPSLIELILDGLTRNGEVSPPQLQLVCLALTDGLTPPAAVDRGRYDTLGGVEGILRGFLVQQIAQFPAEEREPVRRLLRDLVTADDRRAVLPYRDLATAWAAQRGGRALLDTLLARLVERRLLVVQERPADGERLYELAHDTLLQEIQLDPAEQARKAVQEMLDRSVLDYRVNPRVLLDDDKFDAIHARQNELVLGPEAGELLRKSEGAVRRRRRMVRGGMALVAGLALIALVLAWLIAAAQQGLRQAQQGLRQTQMEAQRLATQSAAVLATSEIISAKGTAVAAEATRAAFRIQAQVSFEFHDEVAPGIPARPIAVEGAQLQIAVGPGPAGPLRLDRWTQRQALRQPGTVLTSRSQTVITQTQRTVDGSMLTQTSQFRDFTGELGRYADPTLWQGLTVEAIFQTTARDDWLRVARDLVEPAEVAEFDAFYGLKPSARAELEEYTDYRVRPVWPCTLEIFVSGVKVTTLEGRLAAVWEHDEDARGLQVARFVGPAGK